MDQSHFMGPISQACNTCWKLKKGCSNGGKLFYTLTWLLTYESLPGHHWTCDPPVKEEPKSPATTATLKCKVYLTTGSAPIGHPAANFNNTARPNVPKHQRTGLSQRKFDGVVIMPCPTRTSTCSKRSTSKKDGIGELFIHETWAGVPGSHKDLQRHFRGNGVILIYVS